MKKAVLFFATILFSFAGMAQCDEAMKEGNNEFRKGNYEASIAAFTRCIEADPENQNARLQRAMAYNITKQYKEAVDDYTSVLEKNPDKANIRNSRGSALMKLKRYDEALADFNEVLTIDPKDQEAYNNRGWCKKYLGDQKGACDDWKKSKKLGNSEAKIFLGNEDC